MTMNMIRLLKNRKAENSTDMGALESKNPLVARAVAKLSDAQKLDYSATLTKDDVDDWLADFQKLISRDDAGEATTDELMQCYRNCPSAIRPKEANELLKRLAKHGQ